MNCKNVNAVLLALAGGSLGTADVAMAQQGAGALEEIVVTATRRTENLQDVPISIEAVTGEQMVLRGMERIEDVVAQIPNAHAVSGTVGDSSFSMRGIPKVGFFIDGVWQQSAVLLKEQSALEFERVEVLRGPQGTLFGRDTTGGAIRLVTRAPAEEFGARMTATAGSSDRLDLSANVDIPITDSLFTKWTAAQDKRDGFLRSLTVDREYGEIDNQLLRGDLLWKPMQDLEMRLIYQDHLQQTTYPNTTLFVIDPGPAPGVDVGLPVFPRQLYELLGFQFDNESHATGWPGGEVGDFETKVGFNQGHGVWVDSESLTLNIDYDVTDSISVTSITGWRDQTDSAYSDFSGSEHQFFAASNMNKHDWLTHEFQLTGEHGRIQWLAGLYWFDTTRQTRTFRWGQTDISADDAAAIQATPQCQALAGCRVPGVPNNDTFTGTSEEGWALFGEVTFGLTDTLFVTLGARQHEQDNTTWTETPTANTVVRADVPIAGQIVSGPYFESAGRINEDETSFDADTYRFALRNEFSDNVMAYIGYTEGFNAGGTERVPFDDGTGNQVLVDFPFEPEKIENMEIGLRSDLFNDRVRLNATVFRTDWNDLQLQAQINNPFTGEPAPSSTTLNAAKAEATGAELAATIRPNDSLLFDVGIGILDTEYVEVDPNVDPSTLSVGDEFGQAPELQYNIGGQWNGRAPNGGGITARIDYSWTDDYIRDYSPDSQYAANIPGRTFDQESFGLLNARISFRAPSEKWELAVFGTNLTDEMYLTGGFTRAILSMDFSTLGRPREAGVQLRIFLD